MTASRPRTPNVPARPAVVGPSQLTVPGGTAHAHARFRTTFRATAESAGGYVGQEDTSRDADGHEHTRVVLRVPGAWYDEVLTGLQGTGRVMDRTARAEDVTDQVVDVDSRVRSQRAGVDRIRALMNRADQGLSGGSGRGKVTVPHRRR
ncbi:DUF4349 domain-containing protein [Streptomyces alanosinicus]|uniref:DUF4349 domain-containing protein n=1 Tax=Streptomyces alanosinicus TaxID=68171 RepID=A0A918YFQ9_9ACTN|nr:hypothetical protein GCM10010339_20890 [Streptomyces alanosinicus]